jgi:hypothetical protein
VIVGIAQRSSEVRPCFHPERSQVLWVYDLELIRGGKEISVESDRINASLLSYTTKGRDKIGTQRETTSDTLELKKGVALPLGVTGLRAQLQQQCE